LTGSALDNSDPAPQLRAEGKVQGQSGAFARAHRRVTLTLVALLFCGLPLSPALTNTAAALLILWVVLGWRSFSAGVAHWPAWLILIVLTPLAAAMLAAVQSLAAGIAPWDAIVLHRKELLFIVLLVVLSDERAARLATRSIAFGAVLAVCLTIVFWATDTSTRHQPFNPLRPVVINYTFQNFILGFVTLAAVTLALTRPASTRMRAAVLAAAAVSFATIVGIVGGRTGQLATLIMAALLILRLAPKRSRLVVLALAVGGLAAVAALSPITRERYATLAQDLERYETPDANSSMGWRVSYWLNSLRLIEQRPILGHGAGSFRTVYDRLLGVDETSTFSTPHPHSDFLYYQVERGIPGEVSLLAVFAALFAMSRRLIEPQRSLLLALLAGFIFAALANAFYRDWVSGAFFFSTAALLIATGAARR
jgi:O-antigen ligase